MFYVCQDSYPLPHTHTSWGFFSFQTYDSSLSPSSFIITSVKVSLVSLFFMVQMELFLVRHNGLDPCVRTLKKVFWHLTYWLPVF